MNKNEESAKNFKFTFVPFFIFCIIGILCTITLAVIGAFLSLAEALSIKYIPYFSAASVFSGTLVSSILSCKKFGKPILMALASSLLYLLVLFTFGALLYGRLLPDSISAMVVAASVLGALSGAVLSASTQSKRHFRKRT